MIIRIIIIAVIAITFLGRRKWRHGENNVSHIVTASYHVAELGQKSQAV